MRRIGSELMVELCYGYGLVCGFGGQRVLIFSRLDGVGRFGVLVGLSLMKELVPFDWMGCRTRCVPSVLLPFLLKLT